MTTTSELGLTGDSIEQLVGSVDDTPDAQLAIERFIAAIPDALTDPELALYTALDFELPADFESIPRMRRTQLAKNLGIKQPELAELLDDLRAGLTELAAKHFDIGAKQ